MSLWLDDNDMNFEQAVALSILIIEWYQEKDLKHDKYYSKKERAIFYGQLNHALIELRQYIQKSMKKDCNCACG